LERGRLFVTACQHTSAGYPRLYLEALRVSGIETKRTLEVLVRSILSENQADPATPVVCVEVIRIESEQKVMALYSMS
jgi:hypothetical protein